MNDLISQIISFCVLLFAIYLLTNWIETGTLLLSKEKSSLSIMIIIFSAVLAGIVNYYGMKHFNHKD